MEALVPWWVTAMLVFGRVGGLFFVMPVFNTEGVPKAVPMFAALGVTAVVVPTLGPTPGAVNLGVLVLAMAGEIVLGMTLALAVKAVFGALSVASEVLSQQTAMGMASFIDPVQQLQQSPIGVLVSWLAGLVFLGTGLHRTFIEAVAASFRWVPPGQAGLPIAAGPVLVEAVGTAIALGFQLAGPLMAMVFLVNVFMGILAKVAPKMNVFFAMGVTLNSAAGVALLILALPWLLVTHVGALEASVDLVVRILAGMR